MPKTIKVDDNEIRVEVEEVDSSGTKRTINIKKSGYQEKDISDFEETSKKVSPKDKLKFAKQILITGFLIWVMFSLLNIFFVTPETTLISSMAADTFKAVLLLVIGFYFGSDDKS